MWNWFEIDKIDVHRLEKLLEYDAQQPLLFTSGFFLILFTIFSLIYCLLRNRTTPRLWFVVLFSYYFYYKSSGFYFFLLGVVTLSDYLLALGIAATIVRWRRYLLLGTSLSINLGLLIYFKYTNFFYEIWCSWWQEPFFRWDIFLPVGISFFTFQSLSYTIDVYRGELRPLRNPLDYAFYVSFFPQLVAGPIVRAKDFIPQIRKSLWVSEAMFSQGVFFIISGLFKKAIISDYISVNFVERVFDNPSLYSGVENLLGVYGYALQIYCDFSGYSDIAIGIALLMGFTFPRNFNAPYKATSITDFWRRWHISLSSWLRDYLYISLGGNRKGKIRTYINLFLTMLLGGLWHGASWNFVLWGMLHGAALIVHKIWRGIFKMSSDGKMGVVRRVFSTILTFHFVCLCWIFFRSSSWAISLDMLRQIFFSFHSELFIPVVMGYWKVFLVMGVGFVLHWVPDRWEERSVHCVERITFFGQLILLLLLIYVIIQVKSSDVQPFIYFQF